MSNTAKHDKKALITVVAIFFVITSEATAFDGNRKGFILSAGAGVGSTSFEVDHNLYNSPEKFSKISLLGDFKLGWGLNEHWQIFVNDKEALVNDIVPNRAALYVCGLITFGTSYYFKPRVTSPFISGGLGTSYLVTPFNPELESWSGGKVGFFVGGGIELAKHITVEANVLCGEAGSDRGYSVRWLNYRIGFSITAY